MHFILCSINRMYSRHNYILDQNKRIANVNKIQTLLKTTKIQHFYYNN